MILFKIPLTFGGWMMPFVCFFGGTVRNWKGYVPRQYHHMGLEELIEYF